jgi:hypothetical protein
LKSAASEVPAETRPLDFTSPTKSIAYKPLKKLTGVHPQPFPLPSVL